MSKPLFLWTPPAMTTEDLEIFVIHGLKHVLHDLTTLDNKDEAWRVVDEARSLVQQITELLDHAEGKH